MACTCLTGTEQNGWHEVRCGNCRAEESAVWAEAMRRHREASELARVADNGESYINNYLNYLRH